MAIGHRISAPDSRKNALKCEKALPNRSPANGYPKGTVLVPLYQAQWRTMAPLCLIQGHSFGSFSLPSLLASFSPLWVLLVATFCPPDAHLHHRMGARCLSLSPLAAPFSSLWWNISGFYQIFLSPRLTPGRSRPAPALKIDTSHKDFN